MTKNLSETDEKTLHTELRIKKQQLEEIIGYKTQQAILRSKVKWYNDSERNTKYFHRNLKTDSNTNISTDPEIVTEAKNFYEVIYTFRIGYDSSSEYKNTFLLM